VTGFIKKKRQWWITWLVVWTVMYLLAILIYPSDPSIVSGSILAVYLIFHRNPMGLYSGFWTLLLSLTVFVAATFLVPAKEEDYFRDIDRVSV